jgi:hypothetical protein
MKLTASVGKPFLSCVVKSVARENVVAFWRWTSTRQREVLEEARACLLRLHFYVVTGVYGLGVEIFGLVTSSANAGHVNRNDEEK